jgi:diguanylate cyclase (GGDEF)-like protein
VSDPSGRDPQSPLTILTEASAALAQGDDIDTTLGRLLAIATTALGAPVATIQLQDPDRAGLQLAVSIGLDDTARENVEAALGTADDPVAAAARIGQAGSTTEGAFVAASGVRSVAFRPLVVGRGGIDLVLGVLAVGWDEDHALSDAEGSILDALTGLTAIAVDRGRLASMIAERSEWFERMAHTDPLTGIANQRTFARILELELARAGRQGGEVSLAIFDIDDFAATNEASGHEAGDDILRSVASVLAESVRLVDTVARYGGDEFVVIAPGSAGVTVARRVLDGIAALEPVDGRRVSVSAGVARFPADGASAEDLLAAAAVALASARAEGQGRLASARLASEG